MKTEQIKRRLYRIEKAVKEALHVPRIYYLVSLSNGEEAITPLWNKESEEQGATLKDIIIDVPDNTGAEGGWKWH